MSVISIMIVDSNPLRLDKFSASFAGTPDLKVVSSVSKRETAIKQLSLEPRVIIVNPDILKQHTLSRFLRSLQTKLPETRVLLLHETRPDDEQLIEEIRLGVHGYLRPTDSPAILAKALRAVVSGEIWAERRILEKTIAKHMLMPEMLRERVPDLAPLTSREMDMLTMVMKGSSNREIAEQSNISERTVKTHLYRVYRKLKVKSRAKAIALLSQS